MVVYVESDICGIFEYWLVNFVYEVFIVVENFDSVIVVVWDKNIIIRVYYCVIWMIKFFLCVFMVIKYV